MHSYGILVRFHRLPPAWIPYSGKDLGSVTKYFWKVRIWDNNDRSSGWSEVSSFITGLINEGDWDGAKWIGYEEIPDSLLLVPGVHGNGNNLGEVAKKRTIVPYFRKEFSLRKGSACLCFCERAWPV